MQLSVPSVRLSPSLDDIQRAINRSSVAVLGSAKRMMQVSYKFGFRLGFSQTSYDS